MSFREYLKWGMVQSIGICLVIVGVGLIYGGIATYPYGFEVLYLHYRFSPLSMSVSGVVLMVVGLLLRIWGSFRMKVCIIEMGAKRGLE